MKKTAFAFLAMSLMAVAGSGWAAHRLLVPTVNSHGVWLQAADGPDAPGVPDAPGGPDGGPDGGPTTGDGGPDGGPTG